MNNTENFSIDDLLATASDLPDDRVAYANNVRVNVTLNEVTLDFYYVSPDPQNTQGKPKAKYVSRIVLPISVAKETGDLINNSMTTWEKMSGVSLPLGVPTSGRQDEAIEATLEELDDPDDFIDDPEEAAIDLEANFREAWHEAMTGQEIPADEALAAIRARREKQPYGNKG
jgi:Protein of unknown function (DUF3467)